MRPRPRWRFALALIGATALCSTVAADTWNYARRTIDVAVPVFMP